MIKKSLMALGALSVVGALAFGWDTFSYVKTLVVGTKAAVRDAVPIEFELARAKTMAEDVLPSIRKNMGIVAKEEVEVNNLARQIAKSEDQLARDKSVLKAQQVSTGELKGRFATYKLNEATLTNLKKIYDVRSANLQKSKEKLQEMMANRSALKSQIQFLQARLDNAKLLQDNVGITIDDSQYSKLQALMQNLDNRIQVEERLVETGKALSESAEENTAQADEDVKTAINRYFGADAASVATGQ